MSRTPDRSVIQPFAIQVVHLSVNLCSSVHRPRCEGIQATAGWGLRYLPNAKPRPSRFACLPGPHPLQAAPHHHLPKVLYSQHSSTGNRSNAPPTLEIRTKEWQTVQVYKNHQQDNTGFYMLFADSFGRFFHAYRIWMSARPAACTFVRIPTAQSTQASCEGFQSMTWHSPHASGHCMWHS
jgi:hypothetical protein